MSATPSVRQAYEEHLRATSLLRFRGAALLVAMLVPVGGVTDWLRDRELLWRISPFRLPIVAAALALWGLSFTRTTKERPIMLSVPLVLVAGGGLTLLAHLGGPELPEYYVGLCLVIMGLNLLAWTTRVVAAMAVALCLTYMVPGALVWGVSSVEFVVACHFLALSSVVSLAVAYFGGRKDRQDFEAKLVLEQRTAELRVTSARLADALERQRTLDQARLRFFANVTHELRTPLTLILATLEVLRDEEGARTPVMATHLSDLQTSARMLLREINGLLDLARIDAGKLNLQTEPLDVGALLADVGRQLRPMATGREQDFAVTVQESTAMLVEGDADRLSTVVRNLVTNALKFSPKGGTVQVHAAASADEVLLTIEDSGPGIAEGNRQVIFERFVRLEGQNVEAVQGTGIGLPLAKELVELHRGRISVGQSALGGARFEVRLPRVVAEVVRAPRSRAVDPEAIAAESPVGAAGRRERVLVIEDDDPLRSFLVRFLSRHVKVLAAADGEAGLAAVRQERPDLVLSDVVLPKLNGTELTRALKEDPATVGIPVILMTGLEHASLEGFGAGADDFVVKPFSPNELLARVLAHLRMQGLSRELAQAQKLAMLGTLASGLAHEVRNPINAVVNSVELVRKGLETAPESRDRSVALELLEVVADAAHRIGGLVTDLLEFSHAGGYDLASWSPTEGVETSLRLLRHRIEQAQVHLELGYLGTVLAQPDRLNQVVMNLLDNALRAAGGKGEIWVSTRGEAGGVLLEVRDSGPGIAPDVLPRVFDPFFTTRSAGEGTGLGLHLSRQIVESQGGRLDVSSARGAGATFRMWIPDRRSEPR